jgi:hypothetical protein
MSEFVSVRDLVFGFRRRVAEMTSTGDVIMRDRAYPMPVEVTSVVSAIEVSETYYYDDFGRFCVADDEAKIKIKQVLEKCHTLMLFHDIDGYGDLKYPSHRAECPVPGYSSLEAVQQWISFGWPEDKLPDFEACYKQWQTDNGMAGESVQPLQRVRIDPFPQNHIWKLMSQILKLAVGEEAHQLIKKDVYKEAVSALENKGLRWAENEKKAVRRHLKTIVANAQK